MSIHMLTPRCTKALLLSALLVEGACSSPTVGSGTKIVGGRSVADSDRLARSTVALLRKGTAQFCTGTLLDSRHVLTAAHCRSDYSGALAVGFGASVQDGLDAEHVVAAASFRAHPSYDASLVHGGLTNAAPNDIALITLAADAPAGYEPVQMLSAGDELSAGTSVTIAGYGLTGADEPGSNGQLRRAATRISEASEEAKEFVLDGAAGRACGGDSGGPAYVSRGGQLVLAGLTSRGEGRCSGRTISTDIRYFVDWLNR